MLGLMKTVFENPVPYQDKIMYMTSLRLNNTIGSDKNAKNSICCETIIQLLSSSATKFEGLQLLNLALEQNTDIYRKARWFECIFESIKNVDVPALERLEACKILTRLVPLMANDAAYDSVKEDLVKDIFPHLLDKIEKNVEWAEEACYVVRICLRTFPAQLTFYQKNLLSLVSNQACFSVSSKTFEVLAECFCELPNCSKEKYVQNYQERWSEIYLRLLRSIEISFLECMKYISGMESIEKLDIEEYVEFEYRKDTENKTFFSEIAKKVRRFINLSKCLAKLLSTNFKYEVHIPITHTLRLFSPLLTISRKERLTNMEEDVVVTFIVQMRLAALVVIESLMLNCNLLKRASEMNKLIFSAIRQSSNASSEIVSEFRQAVWKLGSVWLDGYGCSASKELVGSQEILQQILIDISIVATESHQDTENNNKSKRNINSETNSLRKKNREKVCEAALNFLESLLYAGMQLPKEILQDFYTSILDACITVHSSYPIPAPYDNENCREKLYSTILTIITVLQPVELQLLQKAMGILTFLNKDPSFKVRKLCNRVSSIYRLQFYPKRPLPKSSGKMGRQQNMNEFTEWSSEKFVEVREDNVTDSRDNIQIVHSFSNENEVEVTTDDYMEMEPQYSEQNIENQCNGEEDMLEMQSSSQCQDDEESDDDDEEEEEEEERSYGDEEMIQEDEEEPLEEVYISASRKMPTSPPVQINSETAQSLNEQEYEGAPCAKEIAANSMIDSRVNGEENLNHQEGMPSTSNVVTNENGIFEVENDDLDEENGEEDEDESNPAEKRVDKEEYCPPTKKQKVETKDDEVHERIEIRSPTLEEMKADFLELLPKVEEVKTGTELSTTS